MTGIYKITSPTGKVYIGQSYDIPKRLSQYKNLHCKDQQRIYNSLMKHGVDAHSFGVLFTTANGDCFMPLFSMALKQMLADVKF